MFALSTDCTVTVTFRPSENILHRNVLRYVTTALFHLLLYFGLELSLFGGGDISTIATSGVPRGGFGVFKPPPEILKISVESSIA